MPVLALGHRLGQQHARSVHSLPDVVQVNTPGDLLRSEVGEQGKRAWHCEWLTAGCQVSCMMAPCVTSCSWVRVGGASERAEGDTVQKEWQQQRQWQGWEQQ